MARRRSKDNELNIARAAYLRGECRMTQAAIAKVLFGENCTAGDQSNVSRWLRIAKDRKWLVDHEILRFQPHKLEPEMLEAATKVDAWGELLNLLGRVPTKTGVKVSSVRVFECEEPEPKRRDGSQDDLRNDAPTQRAANLLDPSVRYDDRLRRFSQHAAGSVADVIRRSSITAVSWGNTLATVIDELADRWYEPAISDKEFFPVQAEEVRSTVRSHRSSSSVLAERLDEIVNSPSESAARNGRTLSLSGLPPFVPKNLQGQPFDEYLNSFSTYTQIFGRRPNAPTKNALIEKSEALLTSIGSRSRLLGGGGFLETLKVHSKLKDISGLVAGDVGGVLVPAPKMSDSQKKTFAELNSIFTTLRQEHLINLAKRARDEKIPGVVIVSILGTEEKGGTRAETLAAVVREGWVNELIIDKALADSLAKELKRNL